MNRLALALLVASTLACERAGEAVVAPGPEQPVAREPAPVVDHGLAPSYQGTWIGPELRVSFAGPWVLIGPREPGPGAEPIELRVAVERSEGEAFALRTSVAGIYAADFVRPSDWTLLVEQGELALAMGDEPLAPYLLAADEPLLLGPALLHEVAIPGSVAGEDVLACLEVASEICRALEADGPRALGCREAQWAVCVAHADRSEADPTVRAANAIALAIHQSHAALRFAEGMWAAAVGTPVEAAAAVYLERARERGRGELARLRRDGPLPSDDPHLAGLLAGVR